MSAVQRYDIFKNERRFIVKKKTHNIRKWNIYIYCVIHVRSYKTRWWFSTFVCLFFVFFFFCRTFQDGHHRRVYRRREAIDRIVWVMMIVVGVVKHNTWHIFTCSLCGLPTLSSPLHYTISRLPDSVAIAIPPCVIKRNNTCLNEYLRSKRWTRRERETDLYNNMLRVRAYRLKRTLITVERRP